MCRLPRIDDPDDDQSMTTMVCDKCGRKQLIYVDEVQFGCDIESIVAEMRFRVEQLTGLTCSAGLLLLFLFILTLSSRYRTEWNARQSMLRQEQTQWSVLFAL